MNAASAFCYLYAARTGSLELSGIDLREITDAVGDLIDAAEELVNVASESVELPCWPELQRAIKKVEDLIDD